MTTAQPATCQHQNCDQRIRPWFELCAPHHESKKNGEIDQCPDCSQYKETKYPQCRHCHAANPPNKSQQQGKYQPESNPKWDAADRPDDLFFVYLLKLNGGQFYAGHTRELRERMSEHRDGKTPSTANKNPRLVWFDTVPTREEASEAEAYLKELIDRNEREIRRMVTEFLDLIREVDTDADRTPEPHLGDNKTGYRPPRFGYRR